MKHPVLLCVLLLYTLVQPQSFAQQIIAQKTSGIAPMGVHFTVRDTAWSLIKDSDYEWVFPGGDTVTGYQAVHTFMDEGWVSLTTTRPDHTSFIDSVYITVTSADVGFSGDKTVCISSTGDFSGCPAGALHTTAGTLESVSFNPDHRYLFRTGDTFTISTAKTMPSLTSYASYGTAAAPPLILVSGDAASTTFWMGDDVSVSDIDFQGIEWVSSAAWGGTMYGEGRLFAPENDATFYQLNIKNMTAFAIMDDAIGAKYNLVIDGVDAENLGSYFLYAGPSPSVSYSGVQNSRVRNVLSNHGIRLNGGTHFVAHNIAIDSVDRSQITFRGLRYGLVNDSKFTGKALYKNSIRNISDDASVSDTVHYIIFERNQYQSRDNEFAFDFNIGSDIVVRNNLLLNSSLNVGENLSGIRPQRVEIVHNTFYQDNYDWFSMVSLRSGSTGIFKGNIAYGADCGGACISENPFSAASNQNTGQWQFNYNAYYISGDPGGSNFKNSMSFSTWQTALRDDSSRYGAMTFVNAVPETASADFSPVSGTMLAIAPFLTHRDLLNNKRSYLALNDAGAVSSSTPTGIANDENRTAHLRIFPNPARDYLYIASDLSGIVQLRLFDINGKLLYETTRIDQPVAVSLYPPGIYHLSLANRQGYCTYARFVKY